MIRVLARLLIKDYQTTEDERVRRSYGMLCSGVGIVLNLLLFAGKYAAGVLRERKERNGWPRGFFNLYGACDDDTFVVPPDVPFDLDPIPALELR